MRLTGESYCTACFLIHTNDTYTCQCTLSHSLKYVEERERETTVERFTFHAGENSSNLCIAGQRTNQSQALETQLER